MVPACCAAGMVVWQAEGAYCFRGETLKTITYLFRRQVGACCAALCGRWLHWGSRSQVAQLVAVMPSVG